MKSSLCLVFFAVLPAFAALDGLNGGFEKYNSNSDRSAITALLERAEWNFQKPLILPDRWRPNPNRKNGAFQFLDNKTIPQSGKYCLSFKGDIMSEFFLYPEVGKRFLKLRFWSQSKEPGKAGIYMYGENNIFLGELSKEFPAAEKWTEHTVGIRVPELSRGEKVLFCVIAFQSGTRESCSIDDVDAELVPDSSGEVTEFADKPNSEVKKTEAAVYTRTGDNFQYPDFKLSKGETKKLVFQQKDADSRQVRLVLEARFDWTGLGGYAPGLTITVNGQTVTGNRLLNKPLKFKTRGGGEGKWATDFSTYNIMYSKDFSDEHKTNVNYGYGLYEKEQEPYRFVFDLTGLTQHVGDNDVILTAPTLPMVFRNVKIEFCNDTLPRINDPKSVVSPAPTGAIVDYTLKSLPKAKLILKASDDGAVQFEEEGVVFSLASRFSLPDKKWLALIPGEKMKLVSFPFEKTFDTPEYTLTRRLEILNGRVRISDTFTNKQDKITGVILENTLGLPEKSDKDLLGGMEVMLRETASSTNPSVGAQLGKSFVALVLEDDIFRSQGRLFHGEKTIGICNRSLGLPPKSSHRLEWSLYYLPIGDYYDFVNAVRHDWNSNISLDGPFSFPYGGGCENMPFTQWEQKTITKSTVDEFLTRRQAKYIITHVPGNYSVSPFKQTREHPFLGHGTALSDPDFQWWCSMTKNMTAAFRKYAPQVQVHVYLHKNLCSEQNNREIYTDSLALDSTLRRLGQIGIHAYFQPTLNNSYGKALSKVYRRMVEEFDANIYMDEICLSVTAWDHYPEWDQCTAIINPVTHEVTGTISIPNLLVRPWLDEMLAYLKSKNKKLIANGPPATRTLHEYKAWHFVEQGMGMNGLTAAHFSTPLGFCYHHGKKGFEHFRDALECGFVCFLYSGDWSRHCFPFTPVELHNGYIVCRERIITKVSGKFGWNDKCNADIFVYDGNGIPATGQEVKSTTENGKSVFEVRMPSDHVAIIVKK